MYRGGATLEVEPSSGIQGTVKFSGGLGAGSGVDGISGSELLLVTVTFTVAQGTANEDDSEQTYSDVLWVEVDQMLSGGGSEFDEGMGTVARVNDDRGGQTDGNEVTRGRLVVSPNSIRGMHGHLEPTEDVFNTAHLGGSVSPPSVWTVITTVKAFDGPCDGDLVNARLTGREAFSCAVDDTSLARLTAQCDLDMERSSGAGGVGRIIVAKSGHQLEIPFLVWAPWDLRVHLSNDTVYRDGCGSQSYTQVAAYATADVSRWPGLPSSTVRLDVTRFVQFASSNPQEATVLQSDITGNPAITGKAPTAEPVRIGVVGGSQLPGGITEADLSVSSEPLEYVTLQVATATGADVRHSWNNDVVEVRSLSPSLGHIDTAPSQCLTICNRPWHTQTSGSA